MKKLYIGIDIGGTKVAAGLVTSSGKLLEMLKEPVPKKSTKKILTLLKEMIKELLSEHDLKISSIAGIGIGVPGLVDTRTGRILATPNLELSGYPLKEKLTKLFATKVAIGNDVNAGILGEWYWGAAQGFNNVLGIFPGTGVGGGVISDGKIMLGYKGAAAEVGHLIIDYKGPQCHCGNRGCLEAFASRWAIERDIKAAVNHGEKSILKELTDHWTKQIKSKLLARALKKRDRVVTRVIQNAARRLGDGCVAARHAYSPEIIVLGGGLIEACGDFILPIVQKTVDRDPFFKKLGRCRVVKAALGDSSGILGAAVLVIA